MRRRGGFNGGALGALAGLVWTSEAFAQTCDMAAAEAELRARHAAVIEHHLTGDVEAWLAGESDVIVGGGDGEVTTSTKAERRARRSAYLKATEFTRYEDTETPVVEVSRDCSLGWVIVEVAVEGTTETADGPAPLAFRSSWVELYRRVDGDWLMVGSVSDVVLEEAG